MPEMANRAATAGAGLAAAAKAVALGDHKRLLDDYAQRVRDSHRAGMQALGVELPPEPEGDDMGDVFVCGDITTTTQQAPQETQAIQAGPAPTKEQKIWPYVLAAALGSGGLGVGLSALLNALTAKDSPAIVQPDTDRQYEVRISSGTE